MTTTHVQQDNAALVQKGFEAFAAGNMATLTELFDAKAVWKSSPTGVIAGMYHDRDAILASFAQMHKETSGTFRSKPIAMATSGDKVFVQTEASGERHGRSLHVGEMIVFTLRDGHVREVQIYHADQAAAAAFWA